MAKFSIQKVRENGGKVREKSGKGQGFSSHQTAGNPADLSRAVAIRADFFFLGGGLEVPTSQSETGWEVAAL